LINFKEIKNKIFTRENLYCLIIISITFFLDRYSKILVLQKISENSYYVNNYLNLDLLWNTGIGFGLLSSNSSFLYNSITVVIALVIIFLIIISLKSDKFEKITFSLIIGGAIGNFYDRVIFKAVPDFIDFHYHDLHWFTFNLADIFITFGILIYLLKDVVRLKYEKN
tara:strand:+ start:324 stop:827 length:504 start_codon:yes stop_codon:yes gene_type:complete